MQPASALRILFATMWPMRQTPAGTTSDLASARYRALIPAQQLARMGHQVQVSTKGAAGWSDEVKQAACDVLVVSKSLDPATGELAAAMKARGTRIVVDFCDDHFDHPEHGAHQRNLAAIADGIVASTDGMAAAVRRHSGRESKVIIDPVEGPRGTPRFAPRLPALRLLWFGQPPSLRGLGAKAGELRALAERMPVQLDIVTAATAGATDLAAQLGASLGRRVHVRLVPWSQETTWQAIAAADATWIPLDERESTAAKSPNRLLESAWGGRLCIADAIPAYAPFADLVPVGQGLEAAVIEALRDPAAVESRLREAQRRIARTHSAFECGRQWARALGDAGERPMRLNLGCGDKILPGYVNVDVVESRAGMKPDVICDLHDLAPFADASAEEVLAVHVVEHFWRWEIRDVLREWVRVLKPGGRMVIECPNLQSACETFLQDPAQFAREDKEGQRTMWVFYGDPKWKDPLMVHRWGYTPASLAALLADVGLAAVRQEPAQFKLREPRDMRVVGTKPGG